MSESALWTDVDAYFEQALLPPDEALDAALAASAAAGLPAMHVSASQGRLLQLLVEIQRAHRVLEIGTLGGYSTLWLARGAGAAGRVVTLELRPDYAAVARANAERAGYGDRIEIRVGPAVESLARLIEAGTAPFEFVFIDADKPNNLNYLKAALQLVRPGGVIVVDNVVRGGNVVHAGHDASVEGVRSMVAWIGQQKGLSATAIQTVGNKGYDGFLIARVDAAA
jgi:predicted O-methyltransferase YrrM